jgi:predicted MFS family arabinose efflux permease
VKTTRWRNGLIIALVVGLAKADAAAVGVVAPALRSDLHITTAQLGLVASLASGTGALCALPAGGLVDRRRRSVVVVVALVIWSFALGLVGFATGLVLLAAARIISGGVATIARPVAVSLAADLYSARDRGRALASLDAGQAVGTALCFLLGALAVRLLDWRWLFWWLAAAGLLVALAARSLEDPAPVREPGPPLPVVIGSLLHIRTNMVVIAADSVGNFFFAGVASFAVLFITERYGLSNAFVDALAPAMAVGVIAGILVGGRIGDRLTRVSGGSRRLVVASACQLTATFMFAAALLSGSVVVAGFLLFVGATILGGAGPCLDAVRVDIVGANIRGRAEAAKGLLTLVSSTLGPVTFGLVATAFGGHVHGAHSASDLASGFALRDAFLLMLIPLGVGALILLAAVRPYAADAAAAGTEP